MSEDDVCVCGHYRYEHVNATGSMDTRKCKKCECPKFAFNNR